MRKWISLLLAVLLVLGVPMTAMAAVTVDTSYGNVDICDTTVNHYNNAYQQQTSSHDGEVKIEHGDGTANGTVSVNMNGIAEGNNGYDNATIATEPVKITGNVTGGVGASGNASVTVNGNVSNSSDCGVIASDNASVTVDGNVSTSSGHGVQATGNATVTVTKDVTGGQNGAGVYAKDDAKVSVGGDVSGGDNAHGGTDSGNSWISGGTGVEAEGNSRVEVTGSVTGGQGSGADEASGGVAVVAYDSSTVNVAGSATGGNAEGDDATGGDAVVAFDQSTVTVGGNATGGNAEGDYADGGEAVFTSGSTVTVDGSAIGGNAEGKYAYGGVGVRMSSDAEVTVGGDAIGGESTGGKEVMPDGYIAPDGNGVYIEVYPIEPGSLTVKGEVSGSGDSADIRVDAWPYIYPDADSERVEVDMGVEAVPDISVGNYDSIEISDYFTEEEARQIVASIKVTNRPSSSSSDDVTVKRSSGTARNGYYMGHIWRSGYITRTLFKVENGAGMKPVWTETLENGVLTITAENEPVILTTWLEGLKLLQELGIRRIVVKTENCETELVLADLIAMNGTEYVLTQQDETATLTVDGKEVEMK